MTRKLFGTDGLRGTANREPITARTALELALAAGAQFRRGDHRHRVVIGKDTRLSGYMLEPALTAGFISMGMDVILLGPQPTPAVAMLTRSLRADLGVVISASHNPYQDNGIKLFGPDGYKLSDAVELAIEQKMAGAERHAGRAAGARPRHAPRRCRRALYRIRQEQLPQGAHPRRAQDRGRLRPWRGLSRGAGGAARAGRRCDRHRRRARRHEHQPGVRRHRAGGHVQGGARPWRPSRHRAGRRCGPADPGR